MNKNKNLYNTPKEHQLSFKKSHFVLLLCIGLTAILAITMINNQFASAGNTFQILNNDTPEYPIHPRNYTQDVSCDYPECHDQIPRPWMDVIEIDNTSSTVTYSIEGQTDLYLWIEGWAVLDKNENNIEHGFGSGEFTIDKGDVNETYKVKKPEELFIGVSNYLKILYDLPKVSKY